MREIEKATSKTYLYTRGEDPNARDERISRGVSFVRVRVQFGIPRTAPPSLRTRVYAHRGVCVFVCVRSTGILFSFGYDGDSELRLVY